MASIEQKDQALFEEFQEKASSWEERYALIIALGKNYQGLAEGECGPELLVKGCQSQVWLQAQLSEMGRVRFKAHSDALIARGLVSLLVRLYDDEDPQTILGYKPQFIGKLGLGQRLSPSRANGLHSMIKQISYYALAFSCDPKAQNGTNHSARN